MRSAVIFNGKNDCELKEIEKEELGDNSVEIKALCSLISTGTETIVLGRKFSEGTSWDNWVKYPFFPGYSMIGEISNSKSEKIKTGAIVASRTGHLSYKVASDSAVYPVPEGIAPQEAAWFALAKIGFMGAKAAQVKLGSKVLIIGGGPIGQMATRWCVAGGAEKVAVVDLLASRLTLAETGGATETFGKPLEESTAEINAFFAGTGDNIIIDSTGNAKVLASALRIAPPRARVIILGDTGTPESQHLTGDVINKGLSIIGAHDCHTDEFWTEARIVTLFFSLVKRGCFNLDGLNSHTFKPEEINKAYEIAETDRGSTMGMILDWRK